MSASHPHRSRAEELFVDHLSRRVSDAASEFEALCSAHPDLADELRALKALVDLAARVQPPAPDVSPLSERLKQQFGPQIVPTLALEAEPQPDSGPSTKLFEKLRTGAPRGTRYKLLGEVARGGMGAILKIWDDELRRTLAMKVVLGSDESSSGDTAVVDPRTLDRFLEEAQVTGQLDHPGIVPVHELGLSAQGRVYFTMRLVKGEDLSKIFQYVRSGHDGWSQVRALGVMLKVCEAMSYAHSKKVMHRDLKPGNVMIGKFGEVYVMDWGLARILGRADKHDLRLKSLPTSSFSAVKTERNEARGDDPDSPLVTMDGDVVGTPSYMPPEQARGQLELLGAHSDVYAVGAMLYGLVAAEMPYVPRGARVSARTILISVLNGPPKPLQELAPETPAELIAIVEKAMAREIDDRYPTMQSLADDLRAYIEGRVVKAYETGAWAEARKWVKRNKPLAASIAVALLIAIGGLAWVSVVQSNARNAMSTKNLELANATKTAQDNAQLATQRANDVLSLSASKDLEELVARAEKLWPAHPEMIPRYEQWLAEARFLIDGRPEDVAHGIKKRPGLEEHKAKLLELRGRATSQSAEEAKSEREAHPRFGELAFKRAELTWTSRMLGLEPWPVEADIEAQLDKESLPTDANGLNTLARPLVDPDKLVYGDELKGLLLARRAVTAASDEERAGIRGSLAWANFRLGRLDKAIAEAERAIEEAPADKSKEYEGNIAKLERAIQGWRGEAALAERRKRREALLAEVSDLDAIVSERRTWTFENPEDAWWQVQLSALVSKLEALRDPKAGLMGDTLAAPFGWGVEKRYEFAKTIQERSIGGAEARRRWSEAIAAVASSPKYGGLKLTPQIGLLPIGEDPDSHLWEFAHLQTGAAAVRGADGKVILSEEMGLVLVLIPGGTFWMGAQPDKSDRNYDPDARPEESPVHEVELSAYFLSKYEMTQGQWQRIAASNPSNYDAAHYSQDSNREGAPWSSLHPVEEVNWNDCQAMMAWLGLVLPSEAQWEYGCRGGTSTPYWSGEATAELSTVANVSDEFAKSHGRPFGAWASWDDGNVCHAAVGSYRANALGLHDVHGNVWEWCLDGFDPGFYDKRAGTDPLNPWLDSADRVFRGGSFANDASYARSSFRRDATPDFRIHFLGCRPARASLLASSPLRRSGK